MTDLIQEIEKAIEKASKTSELFYMYVDGKLSSSKLRLQSTDREQAIFIAGAQFILPLLKKAIEQRDNFIKARMKSTYEFQQMIDEETKHEQKMKNLEIVKLLGSET